MTPETPVEPQSDVEGDTPVEETQAVETTDYSTLTVSEIKEELDNRGVDYTGVTLKADLIQLLIDDDNNK